jgi:putative 4-mercaptohistidine N1-methyltranferase
VSGAANVYESPKVLAEYLLFHYGRDEEVMPWAFGPKEALGFAVRSVTRLLDPARVPANGRALDLGCAVGRSCYELARVCESVTGVDYSQQFIGAAERVRTEGALKYRMLEEGCRSSEMMAMRPEAGDGSEMAARIQFEQGDAMNLRTDLVAFDIVHAANLLCRLREPERLLKRLPSLVKQGGQLLLTTPCTWLEEFTPAERWPQSSTVEWLKEKLGDKFALEHQEDMPFLIREHARKFQWSVALGTRWVRS